GQEKNFLKEYKTLLKELENYEADLLDKPKILCFTKIDAITDKLKTKLEKVKAYTDKILISSVSGENLNGLKDIIWKNLHK
ncbi:MAG: GTPase ObgE, partial [Ignavibacteriae bacterium]|nr:GTPase ObgE [Ignavibacteriota bacterium]